MSLPFETKRFLNWSERLEEFKWKRYIILKWQLGLLFYVKVLNTTYLMTPTNIPQLYNSTKSWHYFHGISETYHSVEYASSNNRAVCGFSGNNADQSVAKRFFNLQKELLLRVKEAYPNLKDFWFGFRFVQFAGFLSQSLQVGSTEKMHRNQVFYIIPKRREILPERYVIQKFLWYSYRLQRLDF